MLLSNRILIISFYIIYLEYVCRIYLYNYSMYDVNIIEVEDVTRSIRNALTYSRSTAKTSTPYRTCSACEVNASQKTT